MPDDVLEMLLRAFLISDEECVDKLMGIDRPLGTLWSRIRLAYCLGLIGPDTYHDLEVIREVRNLFAHRCTPLKLESPRITARLNNLKLRRDEIYNTKTTESDVLTVRNHFETVVLYFVARLIETATITRRRKRAREYRLSTLMRRSNKIIDRLLGDEIG